MVRRVVSMLAVSVVALAGGAAAGEVSFSSKPAVTRDGDRVTMSFAVSAPTDVEVAVLRADGKVVRHLAAGVLGGKNPPPEPLKAGLAQELTWDGKDDFGKAVPAAAGPFKARVRAGTGVKLARFIGQDPYFFGFIKGMVTGDDGNLYVSAGYEVCAPEDAGPNTLRVFSPEGKFIRTLLPFPADLPPGGMKDVARWDEAANAWRPRNHSDGGAEFYGAGQLVSVSRKSGVLLAGSSTRTLSRLDLQGGVPGPSFATGIPCWPAELGKNGLLAVLCGQDRGTCPPDPLGFIAFRTNARGVG